MPDEMVCVRRHFRNDIETAAVWMLRSEADRLGLLAIDDETMAYLDCTTERPTASDGQSEGDRE